jgi:hypothetical protein
MVKLKYNDVKETYSIKGLTYEHLELIAGWASNTVLGTGQYGNEAYDLCALMETEGLSPCRVEANLDDEGCFELRV